MQIRGRDVDFKISRKTDAGRFEQALKDMERREELAKAHREGGSMRLSAIMEECIDVIAEFFKEATGCNVLEDCEDFEEAQEVYYDFLDEVKKQKEALFSVGIRRGDIK